MRDRVRPSVFERRWLLAIALVLGACGPAPVPNAASAEAASPAVEGARNAPAPAPSGEKPRTPGPTSAGASTPAAPPSKAGTGSPDGLRASLVPGMRGFCVHGGAPLVGRPLVDAHGRLYLVTRDGYLHAYESDGRFRFSFTVTGTPLGSPSLRSSDGSVLLGTTARAVYGISGEGTLSFQAHTVTPVWSGLHQRDAHSVVYIGLDRFLYALSNFGGALYRVPIPGQPVGEPAVAPGGVVWIPLDTGLARLEQAFSVRRFPTPGPVDQLGLGASGPLVVSRGRLLSFDAQGGIRDHGGAETLLADGTSVLALDPEGGALWLKGGDPTRMVNLGALGSVRPSGEGGLSGERALLPLASGEVAALDLTLTGAPQVTRVAILDEPLALVAYVSRTERLLVTSRSGRACLLDDPLSPPRAGSSSR